MDDEKEAVMHTQARPGSRRRGVTLVALSLVSFLAAAPSSLRAARPSAQEAVAEQSCVGGPCVEVKRVERCEGANCLAAEPSADCEAPPCYGLRQVERCEGELCFQVFAAPPVNPPARPQFGGLGGRMRKSPAVKQQVAVKEVKQVEKCEAVDCLSLKQVTDCKVPPCFAAVRQKGCEGGGCFTVRKF